MYLVIHESIDSNRKFVLQYDIIEKQFYLENEFHIRFKMDELSLFKSLDVLWSMSKDDD